MTACEGGYVAINILNGFSGWHINDRSLREQEQDFSLGKLRRAHPTKAEDPAMQCPCSTCGASPVPAPLLSPCRGNGREVVAVQRIGTWTADTLYLVHSENSRAMKVQRLKFYIMFTIALSSPWHLR